MSEHSVSDSLAGITLLTNEEFAAIHPNLHKPLLRALGSPSSPFLVREPYKAWRTFVDMYDTFGAEAYTMLYTSETNATKTAVAAIGGAALGGQLVDRARVPESLTLPNAIEIAEQHGKFVGAGALWVGVYLGQFIIGSAWGLGLRKFRKTAEEFDKSYPGYKTEVSQAGAGYLKTLWRQGFAGIGIGNTAFMTAEVLDYQDRHKTNIPVDKVLEQGNITSRRIATAAASLGYLGFWLVEEHYDKTLGIPHVVDASVTQIVDQAKKWWTWLLVGLAFDPGLKIAGNSIKSGLNFVRKPFKRDKLALMAVGAAIDETAA